MTDPETASVTITAAPLIPVTGRGVIRHLGCVTLDIGGIELVIDGWTLREEQRGRLVAHCPAYKHPRTGLPAPAVRLPPELLRACGEALLTQVSGGTLVRGPMSDEQ
jgi:hypothetical protein